MLTKIRSKNSFLRVGIIGVSILCCAQISCAKEVKLINKSKISDGWTTYAYPNNEDIPNAYDARKVMQTKLNVYDIKNAYYGWACAAMNAAEASWYMLNSMDINLTTIALSPHALVKDVYLEQTKGERFTVIRRDADNKLFVVNPVDSNTALMNIGHLSQAVTKLAALKGPYLNKNYDYPSATDNLIPAMWVNEVRMFEPRASRLADDENDEAIMKLPTRNRNTEIKRLIMRHGAVAVGINLNQNSLDNSGIVPAYYSSKNNENIHAVTLVGWDDDFSRDNFVESQRPGNKGAWIALNSYGESFGDKGYFYLSYDEASYKYGIAFVTAPYIKGMRHYGHDGLGYTAQSYYGKIGSGWASNSFVVANDYEHIHSIGFYTTAPNATYTVEIWNVSQSFSNPRSGTKIASGTGQIDMPGYHTITLNEPIPVKDNPYFTVVIHVKNDLSFNNPDHYYPIALERPVTYYADNAEVDESESMFSTDGITWKRGSQFKHEKNKPHIENACIKLFTSPPDFKIPGHWTVEESDSGNVHLSIPLYLDINDTVKATLSAGFSQSGTIEPSLTVTPEYNASTGDYTGFKILDIQAPVANQKEASIVSLRINDQEMLNKPLLLSEMKQGVKQAKSDKNKGVSGCHTGLNSASLLVLGLAIIIRTIRKSYSTRTG